jgi:hypothetical protein
MQAHKRNQFCSGMILIWHNLSKTALNKYLYSIHRLDILSQDAFYKRKETFTENAWANCIWTNMRATHL